MSLKLMTKWFKYFIYTVVVFALSSVHAGSYDDYLLAIGRNDGRAIEALFARGFDPNTRNPKGQPGLTMAIQGQALAAADVIARHPAVEVDALNEAGETALMMAALKGQLGWVQRLLAQGARVQSPGWSPIHYGATGPEPQVVALLLDRGATVDAESPNRTTPLMMAARYGTEASVRILLARGADPRRRNDLDLRAADFARTAGREPLAAELERLAR